MNFIFEEIQSLPTLAWCMNAKYGLTSIEVRHGSGVDCSSDFFYEGCWNGNVTASELLNSYVCAASGVTLKDESLIVVCPSNTMARIYVTKLNKELWISNSMAFVVAASKQTLNSDYLFYRDDISSIINGLDKGTKSIPLKGGGYIDLYCHCNISITKELDLVTLEKKPCPEFFTFTEYRKFLSECLNSLLANANFPSRSMQFKPLVSISRGYDSVTCAVLAKEAGCQDAFTLFDPESDEPNTDNGADLAKALGLSVRELARTAYKEFNTEYEFFSLGTGGEDAFFAPLENFLQGRVFISGFHGDKIWDKNNEKISDQIIRGDPSGADLEEFRLRVGFIHIAIPFFGCQSHSTIYEISNAAEMAQWSIGGDYDRPICRRIAEEAGLPRQSFGQKKRVMSRSFHNEKLDWYFGPESLQEFLEHASQHTLSPQFPNKILHEIWRGCNKTAAIFGHFSYRFQNLIIKLIHPLDRYAQPFDCRRQMFYWSFQKMFWRYSDVLQAAKK